MDARRHAKTSARWLLIAGPILLACGCSRSPDGDYATYRELEPSAKQTPSATPVEKTAPDPAPPVDPTPQTSATDPAPQSATVDPAEPPAVGTAIAASEPIEPLFAPDPARASIAGTEVALAPSPIGRPAALPDPPPPPLPSEPQEIKLLIPSREFEVEGPQEALRVSFDDFDLLKVLNMEPVPVDALRHFPDWLRKLDGERVRVRGFMYPEFEATGLEKFILARDNQICCFGRDPKIYDLVVVRLRDGVTTNYIPNRPFDVAGTFRIRPVEFQGKLGGLYRLEDAIVIQR